MVDGSGYKEPEYGTAGGVKVGQVLKKFHILFFFVLPAILFFFALDQKVAAAVGGDTGGLIIKESTCSPILLMEPRHGSGLVCVMVTVPAGSARELPQLRGISHFLEHMVFDGSEKYSRREISEWMDNSGAFLNAFTREETTVYFTLVPTCDLEEGLDILSQMLLHSIFLPAEIEKERKVIVEEIRKDSDNRSSVRQDVVGRYLYTGSPVGEPVIGTPETVGLITREELIEHYRRFYDPSLMTVYILGDFDCSGAERLVRSYFPPSSTGSSGESEDGEECSGGIPGVPPPVFKNRVAYVKRPDLDEGLEVLVSIPSYELDDVPAAMVLVEMLNDFGGPLEKFNTLVRA